MKIIHNQLDGFLEDLADNPESVVRWTVMDVDSDSNARVKDVFFDASFLIDGIVCELVIECGVSDGFVSPGREEAQAVLAALKSHCEQAGIALRQGRYEIDA